MKKRKIRWSINDSSLSRQERLFRLLVSMGLLGIFAAILIGIVARENLSNLLCMSGALVILAGIAFWSIRSGKIQQGAIGVSIVTIYIAVPVNFFTSGGIYGGASIWFLFGVVFVCLVVEDKIKYFFLASCFGLCLVCYYMAYKSPQIFVYHGEDMALLDSLISLLVVSALTCGMILSQNMIYQSENEIAQKQKKEIEELNRTQNNFFSSMSHEIRTPINTIIGLNEMILREDVSDEVVADAKNIQSASKMLLSLINDILDMSKIESGKMDIVAVPYNVGDMLSDIVNMIWVKAREKELQFHIDVDQSIPVKLLGDEVRIKQILINVLNNAIKYTAQGSVALSIHCKKDGLGGVQMVYTISDSGMGIKKENIPHLFNAFRRVDEDKNRYIEGTGLGLTIVKQLVDLMHGEIAVNSVYTKGSTFVITLPQKIVEETEIGELNLETRHAINARKHYRQSFEAPKAHVLIVDDVHSNLLVAEKLLRETKVQIDTATSGAECLQKCLQAKYDTILMDHLMPEMNGVECLHLLRSQVGGLNQETPVVALTANAGSENQSLYKREGFDGYLLKPVTGAQLEEEVLSHLPRELVNIIGQNETIGFVESSYNTHVKRVPIMISADSTCDLPRELTEKFNISIMPCRVFTDGGEFLDGVEAETDGILSYLENGGKAIRSESATMEEYEEFFAELLTKAQYVIHISVSNTVSRGYEFASEAAKMFDNVIVVNSRHLSSGTGLLVLRAAQRAMEDMEVDTLVQELKQLRKKVRTSFIVDTTEYLSKSGRISARVDSVCSTLMLHPVLMLQKNRMKVGAIWMGTRNYARTRYIASTLKKPETIDTKLLFITYAGVNSSELEAITEEINKRIRFEKIIYQKASPSILTNCGPGCFGLLFYTK